MSVALTSFILRGDDKISVVLLCNRFLQNISMHCSKFFPGLPEARLFHSRNQNLMEVEEAEAATRAAQSEYELLVDVVTTVCVYLSFEKNRSSKYPVDRSWKRENVRSENIQNMII